MNETATVDSLVDGVKQAHGRVDALVNAAAITSRGPSWTSTKEPGTGRFTTWRVDERSEKNRVTLWVDLIESEINIVGGQYPTRALTAGKGTPIVLLHGQGGSLENFRHNVAALATRYHVVAPDLLWHGRSGTPPIDRRLIPVWVNQVLELMQELKLGPSHLLGQSLGGWVAATIALEHPELVRSLMLTTPMGLDPGAPPGHESLAPVLEAQIAALDEPSMDSIRARMSPLFGDTDRLDDEIVSVRHAFYSNPDVNRALREVASAYLGSTDTDPYRLGPGALAQISVPTLLYWGTHNFGGAEAGDALAQALPATAEYHCAEVGHWAQYEQFDEYNSIVLSFLRDK